MGASVSPGRGRRGRRSVAEINVVPYIDVMLVLLIIFMVTAPMLQQGIEVETPKTASETLSSKKEPPVVVSVDKEGVFYLNIADNPNAAMQPELIQARIAAYRKLKPEVPVLVKGDASVPYQKVIEAMALVKNAGIDKVGLVTESPAKGK
ncbi:protein TolR [Thiofaba sp. EF100]|jgi:biopolymer transport protein TolR|uniref:protein TolR n=1 Tax=Thiofaba sp. EF100 TaxID=3121274 RepID=UPI0032213B33